MKQILVTASLFILWLNSFSQNVGIGTTTPQTTLDVKGNHRMGGLSSFVTYDSVTGRIEWKNSNLYVPVTQALMKHSAAADGLYYNNTAPVSGQLEYRNALGEPVFYTNFTNGNGYFKNFLGIGTTPGTNLHIESNNSFPVIINGAPNLYLSWAENNNYRGYLGSYAGNPEDVDFGTYSGNTTGKIHFTTQSNPKMTIDASGNVGIGTTTPTATLEAVRGTGFDGTAIFKGTQHVSHFNYAVNEDTYIRGGKDNSNLILNDVPGGKVGIGMNNPGFLLNFPGSIGDKISLSGNSGPHFGFGIRNQLLQIHTDLSTSDIAFGSGSSASFTEKFRMKGNGTFRIEGLAFLGSTIPALSIGGAGEVQVDANGVVGGRLTIRENGAFSINGSEGSTGQVLKSNGPGSSPTWINPLNALYNNMTEYTQSGTLTVGVPFGTSNIAGMSGISLVINSRSKVMFSSSIDLRSNGCFGCGGSTADVIIQLNFPGGSAQNGGTATGNIATDETKTFVTANKIWTLNPGTYTVNTVLRSGNISGPTITGSFGRLDIIVIQE